MPVGQCRTGDLMRIASTNATLGGNIAGTARCARCGSANGPTVYLRDVGTVEDGTDIVVGYALVNGRRTVYIPVTKRADASTLDVIRRVRQTLPAMRSVVPDDVEDRPRVRPVAVRRRAPSSGLVGEGLLGAVADRADGAAVPARLAQRR